PTVALWRSSQDRRARRAMDPAPALLWPAAAVVPAPGFAPGSTGLPPATADATPLCGLPHAAHAAVPGTDEHQIDRGGFRPHRPDRPGDYRRDLAGRTRSPQAGYLARPEVQEQCDDDCQGPGRHVAARTPVRVTAGLRPLSVSPRANRPV